MTTPLHHPPHGKEDWTCAEYVHAWLERSAASLPERQQRFRLAAALLALPRNASFRFVDLGAGAGPFAAVLLDYYPGSTAVVHDLSQAMLDRAAQELQRYGERVRFVQADLAEPGWSAAFHGERFVAAVSSIAIHNLFDAGQIAQVYREVANLLEPDGMFVNLDYVAADPALAESFRAAAAQRREELGAPVRSSTGGGGGTFAGTLADHLAWLRAAGFGAADCPWRELNLTLLLARRLPGPAPRR